MSKDWMDTLDQEADALIAGIEDDPAARRLFEGTLTAAEYAGFLEQTYHYVRWTRPLCARAGARLAAEGGGPIADLLLHKAAEEEGHEQWALEDIAALGGDPNMARRAAQTPATKAYIAWSRFTVEAGPPAAFLGTAYVLEVLSVRRAGKAAENLEARSGIRGIAQATRFLRGHAGADEGHVAELQAWFAGITDAEAREAISLSARVTRALYPSLVAGALASMRARPSFREEAGDAGDALDLQQATRVSEPPMSGVRALQATRITEPPISGVSASPAPRITEPPISGVNVRAPRGSAAPPGSEPRARRRRAAGAS